jgi:hypothetical protein
VQNDEELATVLQAELEALRLQGIEDARLALRLSEIGEDTQEDVVNIDHEAIVADLNRTFPAECPIMRAEYDKVRASHITWLLPTLAETAAGKHPH